MKLNPFEKKSLLALMGVSIFLGASIYQIGKRNLWFYKKNTYFTKLNDADGLRIGSMVSISGLRVGTVKDIYVDRDNSIKVKFSVLSSMQDKLTKDSIARAYRSFVVGEKRIDIVPGSIESEKIPNMGMILGEDGLSITDLLTGKNMSNIFGKLANLGDGIGKLSEAMRLLLTEMNEKDLKDLYSNVLPLFKNLNGMISDLKKITVSLSKKSSYIPDFFESGNKVFTSVDGVFNPISKRGELVNQLLDNLQLFSKELADNPGFSKQLMKAIQELTITLRALQKTWILEDHVKDIKGKKNN
ncbi:MAG: MCE family protein [Halobacteriovoraceae bacterium]|nr:MCE family protein [Halobacteriovoraceae bacterium]